jgi:monofunctional biosynthetic peptidoglycan transglycosylase
MKPPRSRVAVWIWRTALLTGVMALAAGSAAAFVLAASGVFDRRPGAWTVPVELLSGLAVDANVSGLLRLASSPLGLRLLDGSSTTVAIGTLRFARDNETLVVRCAPCRIDDARLAAQRVALPATELRITRRAGAESNNVLDVRLSNVALEGSAMATLAPTGVNVQWQLPSVQLSAVYRALVDAIPEARSAQIGGTLHAQGSLTLPSLRATSTLSVRDFEVSGLGTERLQYGRLALACRNADGTPRQVFSGEGEKSWVGLDALGPLLPAAVIAAEDQRFHEHAGFDEAEIARVLAPADGEAWRLRGASTLTQQLARTLFVGSERTAARKLRELLYAVEMERTLGKPRILELYLNTVDWGPGLCGARAAARQYFGKRVAQLSPLEAAWLAGILRAPHAAHQQQFATGKPEHERARWVLMQMRSLPTAERARWARRTLVLGPRSANREPPVRKTARGAAAATQG